MNKRKKRKIVINEKRFFYLLLLLILLLSIGIVQKSLQNDTFYTIKIGELIIKNGIDMLDHFSIHNLMYTYPHWLYDVFIYSIFKIGGLQGIYLSTIILNMILLTILFKSAKIITNSIVIPFIVTIFTIIILGIGYITARAQLVTYILFALEIFFIERYIKSKRKKYLFGLLMISLLICNIHVAVWPFYFILFLPYIVESIISNIAKKGNNKSKFIKYINTKFDINNNIPLKELLEIMFLSLFTGLLTPIGDTPYTYLYKTIIGNSQKYIQEHQIVALKDSIITIITVGSTLLVGFISKIKLRDLFLLLGLGIMAILSGRHIGLLSVLMVIPMSRTYNYCLNSFGNNLNNSFYSFFNKKIVLTILFILVISFSIFRVQFQIYTPYIDKDEYPISATQYIKDNIDIKTMRLYNEYDFGSYLIFNNIPVFIDSRADLYTKQFSGLTYDIFDDYMYVYFDYEKTFDFYNITHVLLYKNNIIYSYLQNDENYKLLYEDEFFGLYERQNNNEEKGSAIYSCSML